MFPFLGALPSVFTNVINVAIRVAPAVKAFAEGVVRAATFVSTHIPEIKEVLNIVYNVVNIIGGLAQIFAGKPEEEKAEEMGLKEELAEKKPEDFDTTEEYIRYLREDIQLSNEKMEELRTMTDEERAPYAVAGSALYLAQMEEKMAMKLPWEFMGTSALLIETGKMTEKSLEGIVRNMSESGVEDASVFSDFVEGRLEGDERSEMFRTVKDSFREEYPDASNEELNTRISDLRY